MQKINKQNLGGNEEVSKLLARYTWEKDEIAWYFCHTFKDVFKVRFTGEHWLIGNSWGRDKIYQYEYLECSDKNRQLKRLGDNGISHGEEYLFYTTKQEAVTQGLKSIENTKDDALKDFEDNTTKLMGFRNQS